jgi:hypothetical protein
MPAKSWIKLSLAILDDPMMALLPDHLWRALVELFLLAGWQDENGALPDLEYMAWKLRCSEDGLLETLQKLETARLVYHNEAGVWVVVDFGMGTSAGPAYTRNG